jgi:hypothetical protein
LQSCAGLGEPQCGYSRHRGAIRKVIRKPQGCNPVTIWNGEPKWAFIEHDRVQYER